MYYRKIQYSLYSHAPNLDFLQSAEVRTQSGDVLGTIQHLFLETVNLSQARINIIFVV